jgi:hypothetical protein
MTVLIDHVMTKDNLVTAPEGTTLAQAKEILRRHKIEKLPIVDEEFRLKGLITIKDIEKAEVYPNSARDEKEPQLMVDSIRPLSVLEGSAGGGKTLYLRLPSREDPRVRKVRLALSFFPGESQVVLYFEDCKKRVGSRCEIRPALIDDLKERLGEENVVVK